MLTSFLLATLVANANPLQTLPKFSKVEKRAGVIAIEYCPDNTCDGVSSSALSEDELKLVFVAHLWRNSSYLYLQDWKQSSKVKAVIDQFRKSKFFTDCKKASPAETIDCGLKVLRLQKKVRFYSVRYDEKKRVESDERF
jgi:hypothetical protein